MKGTRHTVDREVEGQLPHMHVSNTDGRCMTAVLTEKKANLNVVCFGPLAAVGE